MMLDWGLRLYGHLHLLALSTQERFNVHCFLCVWKMSSVPSRGWRALLWRNARPERGMRRSPPVERRIPLQARAGNYTANICAASYSAVKRQQLYWPLFFYKALRTCCHQDYPVEVFNRCTRGQVVRLQRETCRNNCISVYNCCFGERSKFDINWKHFFPNHAF